MNGIRTLKVQHAPREGQRPSATAARNLQRGPTVHIVYNQGNTLKHNIYS
jgi:hypothetical protein